VYRYVPYDFLFRKNFTSSTTIVQKWKKNPITNIYSVPYTFKRYILLSLLRYSGDGVRPNTNEPHWRSRDDFRNNTTAGNMKKSETRLNDSQLSRPRRDVGPPVAGRGPRMEPGRAVPRIVDGIVHLRAMYRNYRFRLYRIPELVTGERFNNSV